MIEARDSWTPPEKPTYYEMDGSDGTAPYYTGTVDAIDEQTSHRKTRGVSNYSRKVRLGLDTGDPELKWVSIKDTGERSLSNDFVRLCHMYDVNPESIQEFYTKEVEVYDNYNMVDELCIQPYHQPLSLIWNWCWMPHYRWDLWTIKKKHNETTRKGKVPTWRFFPAYIAVGSLITGSMVANLVQFDNAASTLLHVLLVAILFVWAFGFLWGLYVKTRDDILPYVAKHVARAWEIHTHKNA